MRAIRLSVAGAMLLAGGVPAHAVERYVSLSGGHVAPFLSWADAATNIQAAIDAATTGDVVWVTNGVYTTGGKVMAGDLTNRVALDKALTVQSVNGPFVTTIQGNGATNGTAAVRCAWLTNNATLAGFTLTRGATRTLGDSPTLQSGGGAWCASSNTIVARCLIVSNSSNFRGSGVYQGLIRNSFISWNNNDDGAFGADLVNCTVTSNRSFGVNSCRVTNSIVCSNLQDVVNSVIAYSCVPSTTVPGPGNIKTNPRFLPDGIHLGNSSPCRFAGTNLTAGTDIDGEAWANPPSMGCDQWQSTPVMFGAPQVQFTNNPPGFVLSTTLAGQEPFTCWWYRDGTLLTDDGHYGNTQGTNLVISGVSLSDPGSYQLIVSNASGVATSAVAQIVGHYVDAAGTNSMSPYASWATAATNIQDAINAALANEVVFVTNGVYTAGGKVMAGDLTNRVALNKALLVQSINGAAVTVIRGNGNAVGTTAVRCAWLTNGAALGGFTLIGGATRATGDGTQTCGGGVWSASTDALLFNCVIATNTASANGGGVYQATLKNCSVCWNTANSGGGTYGCKLWNCAVIKNSASGYGSGAYGGTLVNCVCAYNESSSNLNAYGVESANLTNSIVIENRMLYYSGYYNYRNATFSYSCTTPMPSGEGNITNDPSLLPDQIHLSPTSPCRGVATYVGGGTDIDGQPWANPPSMGCDEWWPEPVIAIPPAPVFTGKPGTMSLGLLVAGQPPFTCWWSKDGTPLTEGLHYGSANTTNLVIRGLGPDDSGGYQVVASNASGVVTSRVSPLLIRCVDAAGSNPTAPYTSWLTAATNIQDAVDAANPGDVILVTNGVYSSGGRVMEASLTNRVVLDKPLGVLSVNGPMVTTIRGQWDPISTNGPAAVRCVWMTNNTALNGFTLTSGATAAGSGASAVGGGVRASGMTSLLVNNLIVSNSASSDGGGLWWGQAVNCGIVGNQNGFGTGGGAYLSGLVNCTVVANRTHGAGGGVANSSVSNSILYFNARTSQYLSRLYGCCATDWSYGSGNITNDPQLVDAFHLAVTSPCRGAGSSLAATGVDLDGEAWLDPPSMGCDEVVEADLVGPLSVALDVSTNTVLVNHAVSLTGRITGRAARLEWDFGDGPVVTNASYLTSHAWTNAGDYPVMCTAFNTDNPLGVGASQWVHVLPLETPVLVFVGMAGTNFTVQFPGQGTANYWVEYATNLAPPISWQTVKSLTSTGGVVQVTDTAATNDARFYRVRAQ